LLNSDRGVTVWFFNPPPTLNVTLFAGTGSGAVTSSPAGINCPAVACKTTAPAGTQFTLMAKAHTGSSFTGWSGGGCSGSSTCVVTLNSNTTIEATFTGNSTPYKACVVPNLKGKTLAAAKKTIRTHHCGVGKITKVKSAPKNKGRVISQDPKPGKHLKNGARVALKLGK